MYSVRYLITAGIIFQVYHFLIRHLHIICHFKSIVWRCALFFIEMACYMQIIARVY